MRVWGVHVYRGMKGLGGVTHLYMLSIDSSVFL